MEYTDIDSSFLKTIGYDHKLHFLEILFQNGSTYIYAAVSEKIYKELMNAESVGRYYQQNIKGKFKTVNNLNTNQMASDKIISLKLDVTKINKEWLFKGEKGTYVDLVLFYNNEPTVTTFDGKEYSSNGMVVQQVPKAVYEKDKTAKGPILGNAKVLGGQSGAGSAMADAEKAKQSDSKDLPDNLPF